MISGNKRAAARIVTVTMMLLACVVLLGPGLSGAPAPPAAEPAFALPLDFRRLVIGGFIVLAAQFALVFGLLVHRTRRHRAEREVRQLEAHNSALLRAIPDLMFVIARDGTYVNYHARDPGSLFVPPERFMGRTIRDVLPPALASRLMVAVDRAFGTDEPVVVEYELPVDPPRHYEARIVRVEPDRVLSIVRDVSVAKQALALSRDLAGRLIVNQESERSRLARDLHDGPCQEVAGVSVEISRLLYSPGSDDDAQATLSEVYGRIAGLAESLRRLSHDLHPSVLQHVGLVAALGAHCAEVERQYDMQVSLTAARDLEAGDPVTALSIFRITQEALRNAARHGKARRASVMLRHDQQGLALSVVDDGAGFDVVDPRRKDGLGLVSMAERARLVRGSFAIRSRPGEGTTVDVRVPAKAPASGPIAASVAGGRTSTADRQVRPPRQRRAAGGTAGNVGA